MQLTGNWKEYCDELPPIYEVEDIYNVNDAEDEYDRCSVPQSLRTINTEIVDNNDQ